ncbi:lytic murein transglycosylase B [Lysobacter ciconiae]|uniref:Lytic murein transglycosylase B n=1 Tax=Novilysobacter ciconiae TaxID=2781022 RepID=A0A7S6ZS29_9GAMM|nr:lytic murein transglycosylase B [Lysobacter ciconiae]QOW19340.1 lytic murein transglycosylase B [Lysobacter ciconiae]
MSRTLASRALLCALPFALVACATPVQPTDKPSSASTILVPDETSPPKPPSQPVVSNAQPIAVAVPEFIRTTSAKYDVDAAYITSVMAKAQMREGIIAAMSRPAEAKPWKDYRPIFISQQRITAGKAFLAKHRAALDKVEAQYGVPAEIIVAIIGVETSYGGNTGSYPVVDALYTLAFAYPRTNEPGRIERENNREQFFRDELAQLFAMGKENGFDVTALKGSYAGAMGWGQFMPSSYRDYAVDGNGDGKVDLFNNLDDVFASVANYFVKKGGWKRGEPIVSRAVRAKGAAAFEPEGLEPRYTLEQLAARGYKPQTPIAGPGNATLLNLDGVNGPEYWLGYQNFYAITRYNISKHYAMAVYQLSEAIAGRENPLAAVPASGRPGA